MLNMNNYVRIAIVGRGRPNQFDSGNLRLFYVKFLQV